MTKKKIFIHRVEYFVYIPLIVCFALFVRIFFIQVYRVESRSMEPALYAHDQILILKKTFPSFSIAKGDIIVFKTTPEQFPSHPGRIFIKRVAYVSGSNYFVCGDNAQHSLDSRSFGEIMKNQVIGKMLLRVYPLRGKGLFYFTGLKAFFSNFRN